MTSEQKSRINRRSFMERTTQGAVALAAMTSAPAVLSSNSPNETIGVGHIGIGVRGTQLLQEIAGDLERSRPGVPNTQVRGVCDIYKGHLDKAVKMSANPNVTAYHAYEEMLNNKDIDAIIIATPDHAHSRMVIDAAQAGKDIYIEKCWTRTLPEAKAMLKAIKFNKTVMQLGHDRSSSAALQARELIRQGILGEITMVHTGTFRNRPRGKDEWRWYGAYNNFERPDEKQVEKEVDWPRFLGNAPYHPFSMERFWHWRCFWDYGTGIAGDLLSHSFDFVNYILELGIPHSCMATGGINLLKDGRETTDTWYAIFQYPERGLTYSYTSTFNSQQQSYNFHDAEIRGKNAFMSVNPSNYEVYAEDTQPMYQKEIESGKIKPSEPIKSFDRSATPEQPSHMEDFMNCIRTRQKPKDNEDEAFVEAVTCIMSVESFFKQRTVFWDTDRQEIVEQIV